MGRRKQARPQANLGAVEGRQPAEDDAGPQWLEESEEELWEESEEAPERRPRKRARRPASGSKAPTADAAVTVELQPPAEAAERLWALGSAQIRLSGGASAEAGPAMEQAQTLQLWLELQQQPAEVHKEEAEEAQAPAAAAGNWGADSLPLVSVGIEAVGPLGTAKVCRK